MKVDFLPAILPNMYISTVVMIFMIYEKLRRLNVFFINKIIHLVYLEHGQSEYTVLMRT